MRATRLVSLLLLLQARTRMTAEELAEALEVSVRTVYRDVEALSAAGVPVYGEPGHDGGYRLVDGYRTRLTGLTAAEAGSLFLTGLPAAAAQLGLATEAATAGLKLKAALPAELRERAGRVADRFHLDTPAWYREAEPTPHLAAVAEATWTERVVRIRYERWARPREVVRTVHPHGLVLKNGSWYLVARDRGRFRTYRIARILDAEVLPRPFERAADFDLAGHWATYLEQFDRRRHRDTARLRVSPAGLERLPHLWDAAALAAARRTASTPDAAGWTEVEIPVETTEAALPELLKLGADVEVVAPEELRNAVLATLRAMTEVYTRGP